MSEGINRVTLIGNLGQDPELSYTKKDAAVLKLRLATTESYYDSKSKERKSTTEWHTCIVWNKRAEALHKLLSKGSRVCIEGKLQTRMYESSSGEKHYPTEVVATNIVLLGEPRGGSHEPTGHNANRGEHEQEGGGDDDIPF